MTKRKQRAATAAEAVRWAIERKTEERNGDLKPIEIVKAALCAYQAYHDRSEQADEANTPSCGSASPVVSDDRTAFRHGREAALDRVLFNVNYWRSAYEDRIVAACPDPVDARQLLKSISAWNSHTMRLNRLSAEETRSMFERFCPPFARNNRRGSTERAGSGKGPVPDFAQAAHAVAQKSGSDTAQTLKPWLPTSRLKRPCTKAWKRRRRWTRSTTRFPRGACRTVSSWCTGLGGTTPTSWA